MLLTLGYSNITEDSLNYRMKPIYRDSDSNTVLSVRKDTGYFIDFSKQISGSFEDLVKISLNLKHPIEAKDWIQERKVTNSYKKEESKPVIKEPRTFSKDSLKNLIPDHTYWIDRGISVSTLETFNGGVANAGRMKGRYIFPIFDYKKNFMVPRGDSLTNLTPMLPNGNMWVTKSCGNIHAKLIIKLYGIQRKYF